MMDSNELKLLWLWQVGPRVDLAPRAPDRQKVDLNGMEVGYLRRSKRHYELTFITSTGAITLVCREPNGYKRELQCEWFPTPATHEQEQEIVSHSDII